LVLPADKDLTGSIESGFAKSDIYPTDGRGILFYFAFSYHVLWKDRIRMFSISTMVENAIAK
jgi:hypothetical protein